MGSVGKYLSIYLIVILSAYSLWAVTLSDAQTTPYPTPYPEIPKPAVPQFTVRLIDSSYDIPASNSIDPYTGQTIGKPSQHIEARTIEIRIKNQAFTPFEVKLGTSSWTAYLQYNIQWKGHFEKDWHSLTSDEYLSSDSENPETVVTLQGEYSSTEGLKMNAQGMYTTFPPNSQLDFQVQAMIGFVHREVSAIPGGGWTFTGQTSDWSNTQTLNLADGLVTSSSNPSPSVPEFSITVILAFFVVIPIVGMMLLRRNIQPKACN